MIPTLLLAACAHHPSTTAPVDLVVQADHVVEVVGDRIHAVDPTTPRPGATVLTAERVTAGIIDAHAHPEGLGRALVELDLSDASTYSEVLQRVSAAPAGVDWLHGRGWDQNDWPDAPDGGWPLAADLEALAPGRPIALRRVDGHATWASEAALAASGIGSDTPDPPGGHIVRDAAGRPTGVLVDTAVDLLHPPSPTRSQRRAWLVAGLRRAAEVGLTGVHAMWVDDEALSIYEELAAEDALPLRVWLYLASDGQGAQRLLRDGPWQTGLLTVPGVKAFADGALGSRGARLSADYSDAPGERGLALASRDELAELATRCLEVRAQLAVHAIGDAAVTDALDAFALARQAVPDAEVPLRIEHAQVIRPSDRQRFVDLQVIASMQPTHATSDMGWAEERLGPERIRWAYSWNTLRSAGVQLAFGSDFPVESPDPGLGLWAATRRATLDGSPEGGWYAEDALDLTEALRAFSAGSAHASMSDSRLGQLQSDFLADMTLWRVESTAAGERWYPTGTVVGGHVVRTSE